MFRKLRKELARAEVYADKMEYYMRKGISRKKAEEKAMYHAKSDVLFF